MQQRKHHEDLQASFGGLSTYKSRRGRAAQRHQHSSHFDSNQDTLHLSPIPRIHLQTTNMLFTSTLVTILGLSATAFSAALPEQVNVNATEIVSR